MGNDYFDNKNKRQAYDQDKDNGFSSGYMSKTPESQKSDLYKEYARQYESSRASRESVENRRVQKEAEQSVQLSSYSLKAKRKANAEKKKKKKKKAIIISACSIVCILGILTYLLWPYLNYNHKKISSKPKDLGFTKVINKDIVNIALFGLDTREPDCFEGLSDSIMILSLNTKSKKVKVISLMRDTIVKIENKNETYYSKLNSAYGTGGPELAIKTINKTFNLDISDYATINFYGMVDIIDAVGGIDAEITEDELDWKGTDNPNLNNCMEEICAAKGIDVRGYTISSSGPHHLNGIQAVAYARVRHCLSSFGTNDDYGRTDRQRHVMQQLFSKAINLPKSKYIKLAKALLPCSETSLDMDEILSLAFDILLKHPTFEQYRVPQMEWIMPFNYVGYGSCVYFDMDYATRAIHSIIYDGLTVEQFVDQNQIEKNDWFAGIGEKIYDDTSEWDVPYTSPLNPEPVDTNQDSSESSGGETTGDDEETNPDPEPDDEQPEDEETEEDEV